MDSEVQKRVNNALDNARENGFNFEDISNEDIALDMVELNSDFEDWAVEDLTPYVANYMKEK